MQRYTKKVAKTKLSATFKIYFFYLRLQSFLFLDGKLKLQSAFRQIINPDSTSMQQHGILHDCQT